MDSTTAHGLIDATSAFYARHAQAFSDTRQSPWRGWEPLADMVAPDGAAPVRVLDVGCGNGRLLHFLAERLGGAAIDYVGVDHCVDLSQSLQRPSDGNCRVETVEADLLGPLVDGRSLGAELPKGPFDLVACFGFFHHVPGAEARRRLVGELAARVAAGGLLALSLWRPERSATLARKAREGRAERLSALGLSEADLEADDWLLGWQHAADAVRFCHNFSDAEVDALAAAADPPLSLAASYDADGASGSLNSYLVWRHP